VRPREADGGEGEIEADGVGREREGGTGIGLGGDRIEKAEHREDQQLDDLDQHLAGVVVTADRGEDTLGQGEVDGGRQILPQHPHDLAGVVWLSQQAHWRVTPVARSAALSRPVPRTVQSRWIVTVVIRRSGRQDQSLARHHGIGAGAA
jgi:hypothetical protein